MTAGEFNREAYADRIAILLKHYEDNFRHLKNYHNSILGYLSNSDELQKVIHSTKFRFKSRSSLEDKLYRQAMRSEKEGRAFDITADNLFERINDLVGFRILHLHTKQFAEIDRIVKQIIQDEKLSLIEGPTARIWDLEYESYFKKIGVQTQQNERMYTSVHYIIGSGSKLTTTCELQVRTLTQELWGEVDHSINYPHPIDSISCNEQIKALARVASGAGRLVDSIYASVDEISGHKKE